MSQTMTLRLSPEVRARLGLGEWADATTVMAAIARVLNGGSTAHQAALAAEQAADDLYESLYPSTTAAASQLDGMTAAQQADYEALFPSTPVAYDTLAGASATDEAVYRSLFPDEQKRRA